MVIVTSSLAASWANNVTRFEVCVNVTLLPPSNPEPTKVTDPVLNSVLILSWKIISTADGFGLVIVIV